MDKVKEHIKIDVTPSVNAPKLQVKTNKEQLERILLYLLKNAAFYTEQGRISLEFKKRGAHTHQFIVTDTGIGIPAEQTLRSPQNSFLYILFRICYLLLSVHRAGN